jgi:phosphoribosylformylglycinamidine cyclo-ligase
LYYYKVKHVVHAIANITGGGLTENVPRVVPEGCGVRLDSTKWQRPPIFDVLQRLGGIPDEEMYRTFNMGVGMVLIVAPFYVETVLRLLQQRGEQPAVIGRIVKGKRQVKIS